MGTDVHLDAICAGTRSGKRSSDSGGKGGAEVEGRGRGGGLGSRV